ncbi:GNAT family N-acetyltransferase [Amycolatopsis cihanbeyliensis]|uniref:Putative acetyltransferase n=1 Tax=Amycolatopsis cihanbeyliensis TaxID=1128664 RepID=A0A542DQY1_AMYCI|nr:GNAT family N-acetyltransferase [Amycolatopsis cihanbeyliensis]TQJ05365.1 putative acetyltransferase [Amycolatopsis cihanbeyliensis]
MTDPYPLRPITDGEFAAWARMIADTYGIDRTEAEIANQRAATELERTVAAFDGDAPVGGASLYRRLLTVPGAVLPVAGVATVGVTPTHRRRGILTSMMRRQLTDLHEQGAEPVAALRPAEAPIYGRYGYGPATRGNQFRCDKSAMSFRPGVDFGEGSIRLLDAERARPVLERVYDEVRTLMVGWPDRQDAHWNVRLFDEPEARDGASGFRFAVHREPDGRATGYALYRHHEGTVRVEELAAVSRTAYAALWRYLAGIDLAGWIEYEGAPDEPLPHLLTDPRAARSCPVDRIWVRLVDVERALAGRRYSVPLEVVLAVRDAFCPWNTGRYRLRAEGEEVSCERAQAAADLELTSTELGAAYLGGTSLASLGAAGLVRERRPGTLARASIAFRHDREPFYPGGWAFPLY